MDDAPSSRPATAGPPGRDDAWRLLCEWTQSPSLRKHGLAVEAAVGWYGAQRYGLSGRELETWRVAGLLHDFDYERFPATHPVQGAQALRELGYPESIVEAVLSHGDHTGVPRTSPLAHVVYACDEMAGFVIAVTYVRPHRSLDEVDVAAVLKKMRDRGFARQVPRDQLQAGAAELGLPLEEHVANVIAGLTSARAGLGL